MLSSSLLDSIVDTIWPAQRQRTGHEARKRGPSLSFTRHEELSSTEKKTPCTTIRTMTDKTNSIEATSHLNDMVKSQKTFLDLGHTKSFVLTVFILFLCYSFTMTVSIDSIFQPFFTSPSLTLHFLFDSINPITSQGRPSKYSNRSDGSNCSNKESVLSFDLQMHGYDIHGPPDLSHHGGLASMEMGHGHGAGPILTGPAIQHPLSHGNLPGSGLGPVHNSLHDPSDAFVPFLDSDDSMQHDGNSP